MKNKCNIIICRKFNNLYKIFLYLILFPIKKLPKICEDFVCEARRAIARRGRQRSLANKRPQRLSDF
ncbi:MAG: hypothetical protein PHV07_03170 [Oscillospiraceae bacterium]|nr:hypothetical protein [Oscillospiraceae bacterium]